MSDFFESAEAIRKLAKRYEHMVKAAAALDRIGSIEQAAAEAEKRASDAKIAMSETEDAMLKAISRMDQANAQAEAIIQAAEKKAKGIEQEAKQQADASIADANERAEKVIADAGKNAEDLVAKAGERATEIGRECEKLEAQCDAIKQEILIKSESLADIEKKLEYARTEVAKVFGFAPK